MNFLKQDATYLSWFTGPISINTGSKTHTISVNTDGDIEVHQLVHSTGVVTTTELAATFEVDDHAPCALYERTDGKLIAFWCKHTDATAPLRYAISTNVDDSTAWETADDLLTAAQGGWSYAVPIFLPDEGDDGVLYVFTRDTSTPTLREWNYVYSDDDGETWSGPVAFMRAQTGEDYPYPVFKGNGSDRIDIACSVVDLSDPDPEDRLDVYHAYFADEELFDSGGTSIASNGGSPDFPATLETDFTRVYDSSTGDQAWVWDIIPNGGNPAIAYATFPDVSTNHDYYVAVHSTGTTWSAATKVADAGGSIVDTSTSGQNHYSGGICFDGDDPDAVYCSIGDWADGSRIVRMVNDSGWAEDFTVAGTIGRRVANIRPVLPFTTGTRSRRCRLLWLHGAYSDYEDYDTDIRYLCDAVGMKAAGWTHFIPLDIATNQVTGSADVNGHMMALITHDSLTGSNSTAFWSNVQNGGADIRVSVGATNTSGTEYDAIQVLPCDVYYCDTSTEKFKMRVCLPEAVEGATIQIWVGNSSASARTTRAGHDSDGFPGSHATYSPRIVAMVPDFTVASGNITDRTGNGNTLTVAGSPDYQQTDQWGGPGAMYFTGSDGDMAYSDSSIGRCGIGWLTPELNATTENSEMWWLFHGHPSATTPYLYARLTDTSEPSDSEVGASISGGAGGTPTDSESFSGFAQHHAVMQINGGPSRAVQVNNRTEVTGANKTATGIATFAINGLRRNSANTVRGKGVYHDVIVFSLDNGSQFLHTDAIDTYWANHNAPGDFWDEGTVVAMEVAIPIGSLGYSGHLPSIATGASIAAPAASIGMSAQLPSISTGAALSVPAGTLAATAELPSIATGASVAAPAGSLGFTAALPQITAVDGVAVLAPAGSLGFAANLPSTLTGASVGVPAGSMGFTGILPALSTGVGVAVPAGSMSLAAQLPEVSTAGAISVPAASIAFAASLPIVAGGVSISVPRGTLTLSAQVPTVSAATLDATSVGSASLTGTVRGAVMH